MPGGVLQLSCWLCGAALRMLPNAGPSCCPECEVATGVGMPRSHDRGWAFKRIDGSQVLELFIDHSVVHAPSPA